VAGTQSVFWAQWSPRLRQLRVEGKTYPECARIIGQEAGIKLSPAACKQKVREMGVLEEQPTPPPPIPLPPPPDPAEVERERIERRKQLREERELLTAVAGERSLRSFLGKLVADAADRFDAPPPYRAPKLTAKRTTETIVMQWSDWHAYEVVSAERTRGFGEYDARIFGQRVRQVIDSHLSIKARMEMGGGWRFPELVIGANGDFVSGTIHEVERHGDAPNVVLAVYGCARVMAQAIRDVSAHYERVRFYGTTGNHGRLPDARRMHQKDPTRNWDYLIYLMAQEMVRDCRNVEFFLPDSYSVAFDVEGWRFLQTHGHDVKSWNNIPHYGINRYVGNINALESARNQAIAYFLFSHFHNKTSLEHAAGEWFINGSLIGGTEFGVNALGKSDKPCQWMLAVHKEHGVTHRWPLSGLTSRGAAGYDVKPWEKVA
jgi:hypothetical protein